MLRLADVASTSVCQMDRAEGDIAMTGAPPVRRRLLGAALRRLREQAGLTLQDAAAVLACDRSKISRIETGQRGIRPQELHDLLAKYGIPESRRNTLAAIARKAGWRQPYGHVLDEAYQDFTGLEATAAAISTYEAQFIPGLLQTEAYARAIAAASMVGESQDEHEQFVQVRLTRQQVLTRDDSPLQFWAIVSEGALRQMVGGREVMQGQLAHLIEITGSQPGVNLQVLPFTAGAHTATSGPFAVMKFPDAPDLTVVYLEGQTGGVYLESAEEVARYAVVFDHLRASALSTAATVRLIEEVASES